MASSSSPAPTGSFAAAWRLIKPYWFSEDRLMGRVLLATVTSLELGMIYLGVLLSYWNVDFLNAIQDKNMPKFIHQLELWGPLIAGWTLVSVYRQYLDQMLQIRWRKWMTNAYQNAWLSNNAFYRLQVIYKTPDNPDQRITQDLQVFTTATFVLGFGLLGSIVRLIAYGIILWRLSGILKFTIGQYHFAIPGYMTYAALLYAIIGTSVMIKIARPLIKLKYNQQRFEADFRYSMVRLRENAENVAFYRGEQLEKRLFGERFSNIVGNWWKMMKKQKQMKWFSASYEQMGHLFPLVAVSPRFFAGTIRYGGMMQTVQAFDVVRASLSWLITFFAEFAEWKATADRLTALTTAIQISNEAVSDCKIAIHTHEADSFLLHDLTVTLPDGKPLITQFNIELVPGNRLLLTGPAGSGKTTLLRALAGLWSYGNGEVFLPTNAKILFVPQRPYLPISTLREIVCYPHMPAEYDALAIAEALIAVGLEGLLPYLDVSDNWAQSLSLGEQQKLAFARVLLQKPDIMLLDEASASLDEVAEARLYKTLVGQLPKAIIVSVGHRSTLRTWHSQEKSLLSENLK